MLSKAPAEACTRSQSQSGNSKPTVNSNRRTPRVLPEVIGRLQWYNQIQLKIPQDVDPKLGYDYLEMELLPEQSRSSSVKTNQRSPRDAAKASQKTPDSQVFQSGIPRTCTKISAEDLLKIWSESPRAPSTCSYVHVEIIQLMSQSRTEIAVRYCQSERDTPRPAINTSGEFPNGSTKG